MKKMISIMLATVLIICLAMTSVFAEDKIVRLSPDNATVLEGGKVTVPFDMSLVNEADLGLSVQLAGVGDSNIKILGEVDLSLYKEITVSYGNDGPIGGPSVDAKKMTMALKVNDVVVGVSQPMTGATGWTSADVVTLSFPITSTAKGEVVIAVGVGCTDGIAFYEANFVGKSAAAATSGATAASTAASTAAATATKVPTAAKTSSPAPTATAAVSTENKNGALVPIIIGVVVVAAGATAAILIIKKRKI